MKKILLLQYVKGELTDLDKLEMVRNWIDKDERNKQYLIHLKNIQPVVDHTTWKINLDSEYRLLSDRLFGKSELRILIPRLLRYAAFLILICGIGWIVKQAVEKGGIQKVDQFYCPYGKVMNVKLSDGTQVWLNSGSTLYCPKSFGKKNRHLSLTGEAFFSVKTDKQHPFVVGVKDLKIKVTGTKFNIEAYPCSHYLQTTLQEGKVEICNRHEVSQFQLHPGQMASYDKTSKILTVQEVDATKSSLWMQGKLVFRNVPIDEIAQRLSYYYNAIIKVNDPAIKNLEISCTALRDSPVEDALRSMELLDKRIRYKTINANSHKEIIIYKTPNNFQ